MFRGLLPAVCAQRLRADDSGDGRREPPGSAFPGGAWERVYALALLLYRRVIRAT